MNLPSHQISEIQPGTTEPVVEPNTEGVQRYPRRQPRSQTLKVVGTLSPQAEGIEQLVVDRLHDLPYPGKPLPQAPGPASLTGVALGRMDHIRTIAFKPAPVVFFALEALVSNVSSREGQAHAFEPGVRIGPDIVKKVSARGWSAVEAAPNQKPVMTPVGSVAVSRQKPSYHPRLLLDQCQRSRRAIRALGAF